MLPMSSRPDSGQSPRILYVPGVRAKPPPDLHRQLVWQCLLEGVRRADPAVAAGMARFPECLRLVLWGHEFYADYRDIAPDEAGIANLLDEELSNGDRMPELRSARARLKYFAHLLGDRVPALIRWLATDNTRANLLDSQRYFRNVEGVADRIRAIVRGELERCWSAGDRILLMAHSFGSVIVWDTLWEMQDRAGPVDLFLTLGSPLGTRFIRRRLLGSSREGADAFPRGIRRWRNLSATGGLTALGHRFAEDFADMRRLGLVEEISDRTDLRNPFRGAEGLNVHRCYGYFVNAATGDAVARWWSEAPPPDLSAT